MSGPARRRGRRPLVALSDAAAPGQHVLVLGAGFIGSHVIQALTTRGHRVTVVTRSAPRPELSPLLDAATLVIGDVSCMGTLAALLSEADHVVYAVGSSSPSGSQLDPATDLATYVPPVLSLLELLRAQPTTGLTYISSGGAIYGDVASPLVDEATVPRPISCYGVLKLTAERYIELYADQHGIPATVLRVSNAYGSGQSAANGQGVVARLVQCVITGEPFQVFGDGLNIRDYIHVSDVARVVARVVGDGVTQRVLNVGSGLGYSIVDIIRIVEQESGRLVEVEFRAARPFDVRSIVLDVARLQASMPFEPIGIREGLHGTWRAAADLSAAQVVLPLTEPAPLAVR